MKTLTKEQENILKILRSSNLFVDILANVLPPGEFLPMKSGKKGQIVQLAQNDEGCSYLLHHSNPKIRQLMQARLAVKSWPLHIKRVQKLMSQAKVRGGKIGSPISYYGAHTGRWSGTEGINLQNLGGRGRGKPIHPLIGQVRQMLKAPQEQLFGIGDYVQVEARVLAWLAGQDDLVKGFTDGKDIYSEFATGLFKTPVRKAVENDPEPIRKMLIIRRGFGKDTILGCGYGMGASLFFERCQTNPDLCSAFNSGEYDFAFIEKLIKMYRTKYAKIPEFWRNVEKAWRFVTKYPREIQYFGQRPTHEITKFKGCSIQGYEKFSDNEPLLKFYHQNKATFIELPSGRYLRYPYASVNSEGQCKYRWGNNLWGGFLVENIVQAIARDILAEAILRLLDAEYNVLFTSHDEVICLLKDESELKQMLGIMCVVPAWATGLPINVEGCITERYKK
jgi:DNA polymerase